MADRKPGALDVVGQVLVMMGDSSATVDGRGDRIVVGFPDLRSAVASARALARGPGRRESLRRVHEGLALAGLTLEVVVGASTVALLGEGARPGLASRLLGYGSLEIRMGGVLGSFGKREARPE